MSNYNPSCEITQNEDATPEGLYLGVQLSSLRLEGNIKLSVLRLGFIKNKVTPWKDRGYALEDLGVKHEK